jgi:flagellar protein FliO/FliZ
MDLAHRHAVTLAALVPATAAAQKTAEAPVFSAGALQMLLGLAVVVGLIFASLWLLKRLSAPRGAFRQVLRVLAGVAVGPRERVVLIEIGETWLLLGVAPGQVRTLHTLPRSELPAAAEPQAKDFASWLQRIGEGRHAQR